jgi:hypothetical protein
VEIPLGGLRIGAVKKMTAVAAARRQSNYQLSFPADEVVYAV